MNWRLNLILKGLPISKPNLPESFKVLICELQSLGLDISLYKFNFDHNFFSESNGKGTCSKA